MTVESHPLSHGHVRPSRLVAQCGGPGLCSLCELEQRLVLAWPDIGPWEVVGEGVVRGQRLIVDMWRYVRVSDLRRVDVTAEFLEDADFDAHEWVLRKLVTV